MNIIQLTIHSELHQAAYCVSQRITLDFPNSQWFPFHNWISHGKWFIHFEAAAFLHIECAETTSSITSAPHLICLYKLLSRNTVFMFVRSFLINSSTQFAFQQTAIVYVNFAGWKKNFGKKRWFLQRKNTCSFALYRSRSILKLSKSGWMIFPWQVVQEMHEMRGCWAARN